MEQVGRDKLKGWGTVQDLSHKQRSTSSIHGDTNTANHNAAYKSSGQLSPAMSSPTLNMTDQLSHGNHGNRQPSPRLQMMPSRSSPDVNETMKQSPTSPGTFDSHVGTQFPAGFRKIEWSATQHGNKENMVHSQTGYSAYKTNEDRGNSGHRTQEVRRSMPTPQIKPFLHDYQNINDLKSSMNDTDNNVDNELQKLTTGAPPQGYDPRPLCSPPAPPVRDVSSMKFANHMQSHEKYPSWPVTQPSLEVEGGEPITSPKFHPQLGTVKERNNSPSSDKKNGDEYKRNASDPGFKKTYPFSNFIKRPKATDKESKINSEELDKYNAEKIDDFFNSQPGYPQPQMDQDGHRIGDEKYSIPSPPERENQAPDTKTLSEKIASIVRPHHDVGYIKDAPPKRRSDRGVSPHRSPQDNKPGDMFVKVGANLPTSTSMGDSPSYKGHTLVDTGTSPLNSPNESKFSSPNSAAQLFKASKDRMSETQVHNHSYIVKQMVCYNTGTQTEFASQEGDTPKSSRTKDYGEHNFPEKSMSGRLSSSGSERDYGPGDHVRRNSSKSGDARRLSAKSDRYGVSEQSHRENRRSLCETDEMAPMLRKLTHEYYRGKLHGSLSEKRLSSGSSQDSSLRSPGSDIPFGHYGGLREAESYSSVVIHPDGNSLPFGRDYAESRSSISDSRHDMGVGMDNERTNMSSEPKSAFKPGRHSLDPTMFSPKYPLISAGSKTLHDSRYSSEANLQSPAYGGPRDHMRSMMSLSGKHSKSSSVSEDTNIHGTKPSFDSSPPSQPHSSSDTRSSASTHYSSDSSPFVGQTQGQGQFRSRRESSDSVFTDSPHSRSQSSSDTLNPLPKRPNDLNVQGRIMGRTASMKKAYGIYDETERSYSTANAHHRRQESDVTSNASQSSHGSVAHLRSHSQSDYIPMDQYRRMQMEGQGHHMALIREDSSEMRWEEAVRKSRGVRKASNSSSDQESNYANIDIHKNSFDSAKLEGYQHIDSYNKSRNEGRMGTNLKRTSSEQIRPMKDRLRNSEKESASDNKATTPLGDATENVKPSLDFKSPNSPLDLGQRFNSGAKQTLQVSSAATVQSQPIRKPEEVPSPSLSQKSASDSSIKDDSNKNLQKEVRPGSESDSKFVNGNYTSASNSDLKTVQRNAVQEYVERVTQKKLSDSGEDENSASRDLSLVSDVDKAPESSKLTPTESFRQKYGNRAERTESLRRSRSVNSRDASEYMEMKRPDKPHPQTEWSRIRSQTGGSRPHSIGSDSSLVDPYAVTPLSPMRDFHMENHQRSQSDSTTTGSHSANDRSPSHLDPSQDDDDESSSNVSKSSLIYQNVGYRRPPPVPPPESEDDPPALPPRKYKNYVNPMPVPSRYPRHSGEHARTDDMGGDLGRSKARWEGSSTNTPDNYAEQLRRQARRLSEQQQHMPPPMSYISSKVQINYSQSYKRPAVEALEATPPGGHPESPAPQSPVSPKHTPSTETSPSHHAPLKVDIHQEIRAPPTSPRAASRSAPTLPSPDPPPPPTPQKDDVIHLAGDELPPPPPEVVNESNDEQNSDKYAEDSYAAYRNRSSRQPGVYKRSASSSDALKLLRENNNYKQQSDIPKPPRKRLQQQGWKSEQDVTVSEQAEDTPEIADVVPTFTAAESVPAQIPPRPAPPRPLGHSHSANFLFSPKPYNSPESSPAPSVIRSHPASHVEERTSVPEHTESKTNDVTERPSVQDRIHQLTRNPSQGTADRIGKPGFGNVGNLKRAFEEQGRSPHFSSTEVPSSRRSYEPPPSSGRKFSSSYSESRLARSPKDNIPVPEIVSKSPEMSRSFAEKRDFAPPGPLSPRRPSAPNSLTEPKVPDRAMAPPDPMVPPPVDRSAESGYPGALYKRDSFQNRRSSRDKNASFSETKNTNSPFTAAEQNRDDWKSSLRSDPRNMDQSGSPLHSQSVQSNSEISSRDHHKAQPENLESNNDNNKSSNVESSPQKSANVSDLSSSSSVHVHNRQPSAEELEADAKVQEFASQFKDADPKLSTVLKPDTCVNRMKYMDGIFQVDVEILPRHSPKTSPKSSSVSQNSSVIENGDVTTPNKERDQVEKGENEKNETSPLPNSYWVSPSKAMIEMDIRKSEDMGKEMTQHIGDPDTLIKTKEELVDSIHKKLAKLKEEKDELMQEIDEIEKVGKQVQLAVDQKCRSQQEKDKYKTCIVDMEKIILLLLKLSGLLARAENAYQSLPENADARQKKFAIDKRDRLQKQYEEAKDLKDDIDKRSKQVTTFLGECFCDSEMEDYHYYIKMKSKLTIEKQELEDKLTLGEEQITALKRSIPGKY